MMNPNDFLETRPSLVAALQGGAGDQHWREFFVLYAPPLHRIARQRRLSPSDADDIVQQVMLAVLGHIKDFRYDRDRSRFRRWVLRIAENKIKDLLRQRRPTSMGESDLVQRAENGRDTGEAAAMDRLWEREWRRQDLLYCLDQIAIDISPRRMAAFDLYVLHGVSAEETARELGITTAYVYVTRNQVLRMLHEHMTRLTESEEIDDPPEGSS